MAEINSGPWIAELIASKLEESVEPDPDMRGQSSPALERYRKARADLSELELSQKRGETMLVEDVYKIIATNLEHIGAAAKTMCNDCQDRIRLAADNAHKALSETLGVSQEVEQPAEPEAPTNQEEQS